MEALFLAFSILLLFAPLDAAAGMQGTEAGPHFTLRQLSAGILLETRTESFQRHSDELIAALDELHPSVIRRNVLKEEGQIASARLEKATVASKTESVHFDEDNTPNQTPLISATNHQSNPLVDRSWENSNDGSVFLENPFETYADTFRGANDIRSQRGEDEEEVTNTSSTESMDWQNVSTPERDVNATSDENKTDAGTNRSQYNNNTVQETYGGSVATSTSGTTYAEGVCNMKACSKHS